VLKKSNPSSDNLKEKLDKNRSHHPVIIADRVVYIVGSERESRGNIYILLLDVIQKNL